MICPKCGAFITEANSVCWKCKGKIKNDNIKSAKNDVDNINEHIRKNNLKQNEKNFSKVSNNKYNFKKIAIIILIILGIGFLLENYGGEAKKSTSASAIKGTKELYSQIKVAYEVQDVINEKRKVVIYITNNSPYIFKGNVSVNLFGSDGKLTGMDTVLIDKLVPNSKTYSIVWGKPQTIKAEGRLSGDFSKLESKKSNFSYEIITTQQGLNYLTFFITVDKIDEAGLVEIVKEFNSKYTKDSLNGFQIYFYTKDKSNNAKDKKLDSYDASFFINYNNGKSELFIAASGKRIEVK